MRIILREKEKTNVQFILSIVFFVAIVVLVYFISVSLNSVSAQKNLGRLNAEAALYGQQLTNEIAQNSSLCGQNSSSLNSSALNTACGVTLYCYYSPSCQYIGPQSQNGLSIMCDALRPNRVVATGMCFKIPLS